MIDRSFCPETVRLQFPALQQTASPIVYLDNAATTQKPQIVLDKIQQHYQSGSANVHRGHSMLSASISDEYEQARKKIAQFINAPDADSASIKNIIWTRGATESINLIAQSYARNALKAGDEILVSEMEHHANIVPWQIVAEQTGASVVKIPIHPETCQLDLNAFEQLLTDRTKILAVSHITNVTGTRNPIKMMIAKAHQVGAITVIDGAQAVVHEKVDVADLNADFYVFSGHKIFAPSGIGVLYGKTELLEAMQPWHGGGKMVESVSFAGTKFAKSPAKFEAGTPNIVGALALATAIDWLAQFELTGIEQHLSQLQTQLVQGLQKIQGVAIIGLQQNASIVSFIIDDVHHSDLTMLLNQQGIIVRSGQHCAHPLMAALNIDGCIRISLALYNTSQDIEQALIAIQKSCDLLLEE